MPKYIVSGAKFNPYSFQELVAPLAMYKTRFDEVENTYNTKEEAAAIAADQAMTDPITAQMYSNYIGALNAGRDALAKGLSTNDYNLMKNVRKSFNENVVPITGAINRKEQARKEWYAAHGNDPTYFGKTPDDVPLSDYLYGNYGDLTGYSGATIADLAARGAQAISSRKFDEKIRTILGGQMYEFIQTQGIDTANQTIAALLASGQYPELNEIANNIKQGMKIPKQYENMADWWISQGITTGLVYTEKRNQQANKAWELEQQYQSKLKEMAAKAGLDGANGQNVPFTRMPTANINTTYGKLNEVEALLKEYKENPKAFLTKYEYSDMAPGSGDPIDPYSMMYTSNGTLKKRPTTITSRLKNLGINFNIKGNSLENVEGILNEISSRKQQAALADDRFVMKLDDTYFTQNVQSNALALGKSGHYGLMQIRDNKSSKLVSEKQFSKLDFSKPVKMSFDKFGVTLGIYNTSTKAYEDYLADPSILGSLNNTFVDSNGNTIISNSDAFAEFQRTNDPDLGATFAWNIYNQNNSTAQKQVVSTYYGY